MLRKVLAILCLLVGLILLNGAAREWHALEYYTCWSGTSKGSACFRLAVWTFPFVAGFLTFAFLLWRKSSRWATGGACLLYLICLGAVLEPFARDLLAYWQNGHKQWYPMVQGLHASLGNGLYFYPPEVPYVGVPGKLLHMQYGATEQYWNGVCQILGPALYVFLALGLILSLTEFVRSKKCDADASLPNHPVSA